MLSHQRLTVSCCFLPLLLCSHDFPSWNQLPFLFPTYPNLNSPLRSSSVLLSCSLPNNWVHVSFSPPRTAVCTNRCVFCGPLGIPKTFQGGPWGHKHFYNNTMMLFLFLIVLTSALMVQKPRWVKTSSILWAQLSSGTKLYESSSLLFTTTYSQ